MDQVIVKHLVAAVNGHLICGDELTPIEHISINSNEMKEKTLFVPLIGERVDAHRFIEQALEAGAAATLTSQNDNFPALLRSNKVWIQVADTKKALQDIGRFCRNRMVLPLVGVTGSVGKTTTRQMITFALSSKYNVFQTPKNYNGQIGVPITLSEISNQHQVGVIEMGMSEPGEMSVISNIARVDAAVITNIGVAHLEQLKTRENICREKLAIQDGMYSESVLFLNGDDELLSKVDGVAGRKIIYYGTGEHCHYRAKDIVHHNGCCAFTLVHGNEEVHLQLRLRGEHFVENTLVSVAVAHYYGIPLSVAAKQMEQMKELENRQNIFIKNNITVIDDAYNASPISMKAGIQVLCSMTGVERKIAVLADMKELGEQEKQFHREVGDFLAKQPIDLVFTLGDLAKEIATEISQKNNRINLFQFEEKQLLSAQLKKLIRPGDCILFKGSNSMKLNEVIKEVF